MDAIAELREAVDFLRFYADEAERLTDCTPRGLFTCISPWNFPLAIFSGQISAALAAGNAVLAKPAEPTSITAYIAVKLLHQAGVPKSALQLLPGAGRVIGTVAHHQRIKSAAPASLAPRPPRKPSTAPLAAARRPRLAR